MTLSDLAELADRIIEAQPDSPGVISAIAPATVEKAKPASALESQVTDLARLVRELTTVVGHMQRSQSRSRSRSRQRNVNKRDTPSDATTDSDELCWYHSKYGDNAHHCRAALHATELGKLVDQRVGATNPTGQPDSRLFYVVDINSRVKFLVDTGAAVSVFPPTKQQRTCRSTITLKAANGSIIATYGRRSLTLNLGLRRKCQWVFVIADVSVPILGADFLHHFRLLVDMHRRKLIDCITGLRL